MKRRKFLKTLGAVAGMASLPVVPMVAAIKPPVPMMTMVRYMFVKRGYHGKYYYVIEGPAHDQVIKAAFMCGENMKGWYMGHCKFWQVPGTEAHTHKCKGVLTCE